MVESSFRADKKNDMKTYRRNRVNTLIKADVLKKKMPVEITSCLMRFNFQLSLYNFSGNTDQDTVVYHDLSPPIKARYIRFQPTSWIGGVSMRVELYGCLGKVQF